MTSPVVCFGEIMLRLNPPGHQRIVQTESFEASFAGGEANVAVGLACLGVDTSLVTTVPATLMGDAAVNAVRRYGVAVDHVRRAPGRLGVYYVEKGASQRASTVLYDRADSAIAKADPAAYDWPEILAGAAWLHLTGITPALSPQAAQACLDAARTAAGHGIPVSLDLNYRSRLWSREQARDTLTSLMASVSVCIANEEDAKDVFGIEASDTDVTSGRISQNGYVQVARELAERFSLERVAITLRGSISASENTWSGLLYTAGTAHFAPTYEISIIDRIGGGDSFAAGLIYSLLAGRDNDAAIRFAVAASALKHSIEHDFNLVTPAEVDVLVAGDSSGRVRR